MQRLQHSRTYNVGYMNTPQVNDDVSTVNYIKSPFMFDPQVAKFGMEQGGEGIVDTVKSIYDKAQKLGQFYTSETGASLRNMLPSSDENARPGFAGEKHAILKLPNGKYGVGNYIGPGTNLVARLKRGDPPRTEVDKVAMGHDIRYYKARNVDDVRKADNIMINKVAQIKRDKTDAPINIRQANLMKAKVLGENLGLLKRDAFSGNPADNLKVYEQNKDLLDSNLRKLEQQGYGMLPGDQLKMKILKDMAKMKGKGKITGQSRSRDIGGTYKMLGSGLGLPGNGNILKIVTQQIIPSLMKSLGINKTTISPAVIKNVVNKALSMAKSGDLKSIVSQLSKVILPILAHSKMRGSGLGLPGGMYGGMYGGKKDVLLANLNKGLTGAFKWYVNRTAKSKGMAPIFKGKGMHGGSWGSFWKGFAKGFKKVFKPGAKIVGTAAGLMGHPEVGAILGAASELV